MPRPTMRRVRSSVGYNGTSIFNIITRFLERFHSFSGRVSKTSTFSCLPVRGSLIVLSKNQPRANFTGTSPFSSYNSPRRLRRTFVYFVTPKTRQFRDRKRATSRVVKEYITARTELHCGAITRENEILFSVYRTYGFPIGIFFETSPFKYFRKTRIRFLQWLLGAAFTARIRFHGG